MKKLFISLLFLFAGVLIFISCKKGDSCEGCDDVNKPPIALAGSDQLITLPTDSALLDGSASNDPDGTISEWLWTKISGPATFLIVSTTTPGTVLKQLAGGIYIFELRVKDNKGAISNDTIHVVVYDPSQPNRPPMANAGADQLIVLPIDYASLDGRASSDPDNNISTYKWTKISGPVSINILNASAAETSVNSLGAGIYKLELTVTDSLGLFARDTMEIIVDPVAGINHPPNANAGSDHNITLPISQVSLDGSGSTDPNDNIASYLWVKISGPALFNIGNPYAVQTSVTNLAIGVYKFELKVTDSAGLFDRDTVQVTVNQANRPPIANAGADISITFPTSNINLDGSGSTDPDNNIVGFLWTKIAGWGTFNILNPNAEQTQVISLQPGIYQFELKVTDAGGLFSKDTMQLTVYAETPPPPYITCTPLSRPIVNAHFVPVVTPFPIGGAPVSLGNKLFFAGGSSVAIYDLSNQNWTQAQLSEPRNHLAAVAGGNKVFFAGGETNLSFSVSSRVDIYDLTTQTWSTAELSQPRGDIAAAVVGDKVFFAGGYGNISSGPGLPSSRVDIYNLSTQSWSSAELSEARGYITAVSAGNKVYLAGGDPANFSHSASNKIDIYDNSTGTWTVSTLSEGKAFFAGVYNDGKVYWAGGANYINQGSSETYSCLVEVKDINSQSSTFTNLFEPKQYIKAFKKDNKIVFLKHWAAWDFQSNSPWNFDIYDLTTSSWSVGTVNQPPLSWPGSYVSHNNAIYMVGGQLWRLEF